MFEQFELKIHSAGYRLVEGRPLESLDQVATFQFLVPTTNEAPDSTIQPLALGNGALFRQFADLSAIGDEPVEFANKWGLLSGGLNQEFAPADEYGEFPPQGAPTSRGECLDDWRSAISLVREAIGLWELTLGSPSALTTAIRRSGSREVFINESDPRFRTLVTTHGSTVATPEINSRLLDDIEQRGYRAAADLYLCRVISTNLRRLGIDAVLAADRRGQPLKLQFRPKDLLGVIWLQFAQAVEQEKTFYKCDFCMSWLDRPRGTRAKVNFCNAHCAKQHRLAVAKNNAKELRAAGYSFREIAEKIGRPELLVARWIEGKKQRETFRRRVNRLANEGLAATAIAAELSTTEGNVERLLADARLH